MTRRKKKTSNVAVIVAISVVAAAAVAFGVWKVTRKKCKKLPCANLDPSLCAQIQTRCTGIYTKDVCKSQVLNSRPSDLICQWA
jgi:hypothetical protein